jgi:hypothetical protein
MATKEHKDLKDPKSKPFLFFLCTTICNDVRKLRGFSTKEATAEYTESAENQIPLVFASAYFASSAVIALLVAAWPRCVLLWQSGRFANLLCNAQFEILLVPQSRLRETIPSNL